MRKGIALGWCGWLGGRRLLRVDHELGTIEQWLGSLWLGLLCILEGIEYPVSE